jgi:hypothetical protein
LDLISLLSRWSLTTPLVPPTVVDVGIHYPYLCILIGMDNAYFRPKQKKESRSKRRARERCEAVELERVRVAVAAAQRERCEAVELERVRVADAVELERVRVVDAAAQACKVAAAARSRRRHCLHLPIVFSTTTIMALMLAFLDNFTVLLFSFVLRRPAKRLQGCWECEIQRRREVTITREVIRGGTMFNRMMASYCKCGMGRRGNMFASRCEGMRALNHALQVVYPWSDVLGERARKMKKFMKPMTRNEADAAAHDLANLCFGDNTSFRRWTICYAGCREAQLYISERVWCCRGCDQPNVDSRRCFFCSGRAPDWRTDLDTPIPCTYPLPVLTLLPVPRPEQHDHKAKTP